MNITAIKQVRRIFIILIAYCSSISCMAQTGMPAPFSPEQYYQKMIGNPEFIQNAKGENFCWHACVGMETF
ncbi:MAG: hypothetical protein ABI687_09020, partial [Flavitalea sp.]